MHYPRVPSLAPSAAQARPNISLLENPLYISPSSQWLWVGEEGENFICWSAGRPNQSEVVRTADEPRRLPCDTSHAWTANLAQPILHAAYEIKMKFILDCSILPLVIQARQNYGDVVHQALFKFTRTWCRSIHKARLALLGRPYSMYWATFKISRHPQLW